MRHTNREEAKLQTTLPAPIAAYFRSADARDVEAALAPFAEEAVVHDEEQERRGRAAIREWIAETTTKYRSTVEVMRVAKTAAGATVTGLVSGDFPGSPVELDFAFTLDGARIARLEIA